MGMTSPQGGGRIPTTLSEINVTPLVDVMLVLLIIFMITSSVENVQAEQEKELLRQEQIRRLEESKQEEEVSDQQVPINLPKTNAEKVNLVEEKKLVLTLSAELEFSLGETTFLRCEELSPGLLKQMASGGVTKEGKVPDGFRTCMKALEDKLLENEKLKADGELYLRADRGMDYGLVLMVMARIRKAGITKFGLVAEPDLEE